MSASIPKQDLALYIHWPFCASKCPYCDFNSHVVDTVDHEKWAIALVRELYHMADFAERRGDVISSLYFGGGTPSMMAPQTMEAVIAAVIETFTPADNIEITMEANPTSVEAEKLADFSAAGANRLSMGMQSLDDHALAFLGREHSSKEALAALNLAQKAFTRVSADFIYARPDHHPDDWVNELTQILGLGLDHYSLYQLTLEQGTAFWSKNQRGLLDVPQEDEARILFDITRQMTANSDRPAYEVSNHARKGQECQHNLIYWKAQDWIGIGPGAYGRFFKKNTRFELRSRRDPAAWLDDVMQKSNGIDMITENAAIDYAHEAMMMGLRLHDGVNLENIAQRGGATNTWLDQDMMATLIQDGFLEHKDGKLRLTPEGEPVLNTILNTLLIS
jgi:oxygen-independent coproporphyrinogen-3 oxidase